MTGFGIREQWKLSKQLASLDEKLWRPESVMHQLSLNGSLVISKNHDQQWGLILADILNERGRGWTSLQWRLRAMPGNKARKALWRTSYKWHKQSCEQYAKLAAIAWQSDLAIDETKLKDYEDSLYRVATQLSALAWCEYDRDRRPIKVIDIQKAILSARNR
jgi:hypothetical protein